MKRLGAPRGDGDGRLVGVDSEDGAPRTKWR